MAGILEKLHGDEAKLLMYLADELPREDRVHMERRLAGDGRLREALEQLRSLHGMIIGQLEELDASQGPAVSDDAATRCVVRALRRRQMEIAARPLVPTAARTAAPVSPWWYGVGAAAAAIIIFLGLWGAGIINGPLSDHLPGDYSDQFVHFEDSGQPYVPEAMPEVPNPLAVPPDLLVDANDLTRSIDDGHTDSLDEARLHFVELESLADAVGFRF